MRYKYNEGKQTLKKGKGKVGEKAECYFRELEEVEEIEPEGELKSINLLLWRMNIMKKVRQKLNQEKRTMNGKEREVEEFE